MKARFAAAHQQCSTRFGRRAVSMLWKIHNVMNGHEVAGLLRDSVLLFGAQSCSVGDNATNAPRP
jgi:hypothetical protein